MLWRPGLGTTELTGICSDWQLKAQSQWAWQTGSATSLPPGGREWAWGGICTYSGGKELIKVALFNPDFFLRSLLQTGFRAGPTTEKDLSFSATCLSLYHTPTSFNNLILTTCHFSTNMHFAFRLELFSFQTGGQHASSIISWADNEIMPMGNKRAWKWMCRLGLPRHVPMFSGTYLLPTRRLQNPTLLLDRHALSEVTLHFYLASSSIRHLNE